MAKRINIKDSKSHNPDWNANFLGNSCMPPRMHNESDDMYELRCRNRSDINMAAAKKNFDRPPYYKKFIGNNAVKNCDNCRENSGYSQTCVVCVNYSEWHR